MPRSKLIYDPLDNSVVQKGNLRNDQRKEIVLKHLDDPKLPQRELAKWAKDKFNLSKLPGQATISNILKRKNEYLMMSSQSLRGKRKSIVQNPELDTALCNWVLQCQATGEKLDGVIIKAKARELAEKMKLSSENQLEFSSGWLDSFKSRHGFKTFRNYGSSQQHVEEDNMFDKVADLSDVDKLKNDELSLLKTGIEKSKRRRTSVMQEPFTTSDCFQLLNLARDFGEDNIFMIEETGLLYAMAPSRTLAYEQIDSPFRKFFSVLFACNVDGTEKLPPLYIGYIEKPRAFGNKSPELLDVCYRHNRKACLTAMIFREWLQTLNDQMKTESRQVVLLIPNSITCAYGDLELTNLKLIKLRPNTYNVKDRSFTLAAAIKRRYRKIQFERAYDREENGERNIFSTNVLNAMNWTTMCWNNVGSEVIRLCWKELLKAHVYEDRETEDQDDEQDAMILQQEMALESAIREAIDLLKLRNPMSITEVLFPVLESKVPAETTEKDILDLVSDPKEDTALAEVYDDDEEEQEDRKEQTAGRKLLALKSIITLLGDEPFKYATELKTLRSIQQEIRKNQRKATERYFSGKSRHLVV